MRPKSLLLLMLALGCGLVAAIGINQVMANRANEQGPDPGETVPIFVALVDVAMGDPLVPEVLKLEQWPKSKVPTGALVQLEEIEGRRARTKFYAGEPIIDAKLFAKGEQGSGATDLIPRGSRVVCVKVDDVSGSGLILPGDRVDVLVHSQDSHGQNASRTGTRTFLHNIKVFAVNNVYSRESNGEAVITAKTISLLVTPQQAEMVTLASEMGRIRLVMRGPDDESPSDTKGITPGELFGEDEKPHADSPLAPNAPAQPLAIAAKESHPEPAAPNKNAWKMVVIEGHAMREIHFEDGRKVGSPQQVRHVNSGSDAQASPPSGLPQMPMLPLPGSNELPAVDLPSADDDGP